MKQCTYCGKEYSDDAVKCALDGRELIQAASRASVSPPPSSIDPDVKRDASGRYLRYEDVPFYRREPGALVFGAVVLGSCFSFPLLLVISLIVCIICLTGDVYKKALDKDGKPKVWGAGNKVAAILILLIFAALFFEARAYTAHK